jgi:hypothetical protein
MGEVETSLNVGSLRMPDVGEVLLTGAARLPDERRLGKLYSRMSRGAVGLMAFACVYVIGLGVLSLAGAEKASGGWRVAFLVAAALCVLLLTMAGFVLTSVVGGAGAFIADARRRPVTVAFTASHLIWAGDSSLLALPWRDVVLSGRYGDFLVVKSPQTSLAVYLREWNAPVEQIAEFLSTHAAAKTPPRNQRRDLQRMALAIGLVVLATGIALEIAHVAGGI